MRHKTSVEHAVKNSMFIWTQKENKGVIETYCFFSFSMPFDLLLLGFELSTWFEIKMNS